MNKPPNLPNLIPDEAFGPSRPSDEEMRFWRLIEERIDCTDGSQEVTLACGHKYTQIIPIPPSREYLPCFQCIHAWLEAERKNNEIK
jgi:hypothetical protein